MHETPTVRALLEFEDSRAETLFEKLPGSDTYLWPLARWPIANALASANLNVTAHTNLTQQTNRLYYLKRMVREALPNPFSSDRLHGKTGHLFFVSGTTHTSALNGVGNWLSDAFAEALDGSAVVVQDAGFDLLTPRSARPANPRTWTWAPASARIRDAAKLYPLSDSHQKQVVAYLDRVYSYMQGLLPEHLHDAITQEVLGWASRLRHSDIEFNALLDRVRPQRIYMEDASYGHLSNFIRIAHERDIEVAELQHGWIGPSHAAYNYGRAWFGSGLTSSLPDTLLTFGKYWGEGLRFPGKLVPLGKPALERVVSAAISFPERHHRLLIVSSVYNRDQLIAAATLLRRLLPQQWEIVLRPHPSECADAEELFSSATSNGIMIDQELDVNASISASRAVVGMISTVLFEALAFGVHIGVIETYLAGFYADEKIFPQRLNSDDSYSLFARIICSGEAPATGNLRSIWQARPVESFLDFCES